MSSAHIFKSHKLHVKFTFSLVSTPFFEKTGLFSCLFVFFGGGQHLACWSMDPVNNRSRENIHVVPGDHRLECYVLKHLAYTVLNLDTVSLA